MLQKGALDRHRPRGALVRAVDGVVGTEEVGLVAAFTLECQRVAQAAEHVVERVGQRSAIRTVILARLVPILARRQVEAPSTAATCDQRVLEAKAAYLWIGGGV